MHRRTFIKQSAIGMGVLAGVHGGILKMEPAADAQESPSAVHVSHEGASEKSLPAWGTNAGVLKTPWSTPPSTHALLDDQEHSLVFSQFYRVGSANLPATPTECRISYGEDALYVTFYCEEVNLSFPYAHLDEPGWPNADWHSLQGLPSGSQPICPPYPDEVDLLLQPDTGIPVYYQFAATRQGLKFGCRRELRLDAKAAPDDAATTRHSQVVSKKVDGFEAAVSTRANAWTVVFTIPWATIGARPRSRFGFLPMRTRWRKGEFSSPVALDFNEGLPVDLLVEIHTSGAAEMADSQSSLCQLPSGSFRWQRPLVAMDPDVEIRRQIWEMESSLSTPTDRTNLPRRLYLTQCWMDLLMQEGFTPVPGMWGILKHDLSLAPFRQRVNAAFQMGDIDAACRLLDNYLVELDAMSRWWYADGSPGNILNNEWQPVTEIEDIEVHRKLLSMRCVAGNQRVNLKLSLPATGGIRIYGDQEGYWKPEDLMPLNATKGSGLYSVRTAGATVVIHQKPMAIVFYDGAGKKVTQIGRNGLAFRFDSDGKILASDFRGRLDPNETIYGFGEKYDHFNENGNVLTLWGTDNWVGNGLGRANTTYKPLPIFHSSKAYMVFVNSPYRLRADVGKTFSGHYRLTQHGPIIDYYFWAGEPQEALRSYTALTGRVPVPPRWAFAPWMGRGGEAWASGPLHDPVAEEESVARRFAELDIPHSAIYAEGPSALSPELNQFMKERGIKVLGYFMPAIGESRQEALMPELKPSELPVLHCESEAETRALRYIDFSQPHAMELCRRALKPALELGEAGSMVDYGDLVPDDALFFDRAPGAYMHNFYYYDYQRMVSEVFREKRGDDFVLYARGAAPGTQRWVGQFAGDHPANFEGLKHVVTGALNLCACGYSTWGSDLGGYFGFPEPAVYMRWFQFGCFSPLMRPHGTAPREPWRFSDAAVTNYKWLVWTRRNLLNYIYNAAWIAHATGVPMMRSMPVAFPGDPRVAGVGDQYMFGPDLLVAPVLHEEEFRTIDFPHGAWANLWDGNVVVGPVRRRIAAPLDTIPVYLRPGAVVPVQLSRTLKFGESMTPGHIDALVATIPEADRTVPMLNAAGKSAEVSVRAEGERVLWTLENLPEMTHFVLYGRTSASLVRVNEQVLSEQVPGGIGTMPPGWISDRDNHRVVISLPRQVGTNEAPRRIEISFRPGGE